MKVPILILSLIACITAVYAQNPRIETLGDRRIETYKYLKGGDSISFTIFGRNDTLQKTDFYRNGHPKRKAWKRDSTYNFDELGRLHTIYYDLDLPTEHERNKATYYSNGQINEMKSLKNGVELAQYYAKSGQLLLTKRIVFAADYTYERWEDRHHVPISATRTDTFRDNVSIKMFERDTSFFENGLPYSICNRRDEYEHLGCQYFDKTGKIIKLTPADSLRLHTFKDNVDCYYGLKNEKGDTIVKPRFDRIEDVDNQFWLAYTGEKAIILQKNGAPMSTNFTKLIDVGTLHRTIPYGERNDYSEKIDSFKRLELIKDVASQYTFIDADKYGIINQKAEVVMPPQYFSLSRRYIGDFKYFEFTVKIGDTLKRSGFVNQQGNSLFPDQYKRVFYAYYDDYFFLSKLPSRSVAYCGESEEEWRMHRKVGCITCDDTYHNIDEGINCVGVGKGDGTIILDAKYQTITHIDSSLFVVSVAKKKKNLWAYDSRTGIFNARTKKWLLDTTDFLVKQTEYQNRPFFIIYHIPTNKYGIMDTKGQYLLPLTYDSVDILHYWLYNTVLIKKGNKYQLASIDNGKITIQKEQYEHISPVIYHMSSSNNYVVNAKGALYLAKKNNKWGLLDKASKVLKPFIYDYASIKQDYEPNILLVKNNQTEHYDLSSLPNELGDYPDFSRYRNTPNEVRCFPVVDTSKNVFFINSSGKVVIPPQYKRIYNSYIDELVFLQDDQKKKKFVFQSTGKLVDFPFDYNIEWASPKSPIMIVKDSGSVSYGVVTTDGKRIVPCNNYSVAIGDVETATFFVKKDSPSIKKNYTNFGLQIPSEGIDKDSLMVEDQNWMMYDKYGKTLSDKAFRFPINFEQGVGMGMKEDAFSLYRTEGSALTINGVQNFNNIRRDIGYQGYALFYNQGLTPQLLLTKLDGEVLMESGRYDGMSKFYGKYALVSKVGKIGLIDSLGKEIITPQDLMASTQPLMDSLSAVNRLIYANRRKENGYLYYSGGDFRKMPVDYSFYDKEYHPDSLPISPQQRAYVWNLMLQKALHLTMMTASDVKIQRADIKRNAEFLGFKYVRNSDKYTEPKRVMVSDTTIAFALSDNIDNFEYKYKTFFYNFYYRNNRWEELFINDLLQIQGEKRWQMNELIIQKVKALKDKQIDCSNVSAFITAVENRWMLTKEGIDFCFDSTNDQGHVIVSFTWAELAPFLKMKIF
jgi:WG containing repeat